MFCLVSVLILVVGSVGFLIEWFRFIRVMRRKINFGIGVVF